MNRSNTALAMLLLGLGAAAAAAPVSARLPAVSVQRPGTPLPADIRLDVLSVCPQLQQDLDRVLAAPVAHYGRRGTAEVVMRVDAGNAVEVVSISGPRVYQRWLHRAVGALGCRADGGGETFGFAVRFATDGSRG